MLMVMNLPSSTRQNMLQIVLLAIDRAVSPSEAVETLTTLQCMLIGSPYVQVK